MAVRDNAYTSVGSGFHLPGERFFQRLWRDSSGGTFLSFPRLLIDPESTR